MRCQPQPKPITKAKLTEAHAVGNQNFSHFGPHANLLPELETLFREYGETGSGRYRHYAHDENEAAVLGVPPGRFTDWEELPPNTDVLFYEGLHGAVVTDDVNVARYADLKAISKDPTTFCNSKGIRPDADAIPMMIDMDDPQLQARIARDGPLLAHVVVRVDDVASARSACSSCAAPASIRRCTRCWPTVPWPPASPVLPR